MRLQRQRLCRSQQLHDEGEVTYFVRQIRWCGEMQALVDVCRSTWMGAVPNLCPRATVGGDLQHLGEREPVAPRVMLNRTLESKHCAVTRWPR